MAHRWVHQSPYDSFKRGAASALGGAIVRGGSRMVSDAYGRYTGQGSYKRPRTAYARKNTAYRRAGKTGSSRASRGNMNYRAGHALPAQVRRYNEERDGTTRVSGKYGRYNSVGDEYGVVPVGKYLDKELSHTFGTSDEGTMSSSSFLDSTSLVLVPAISVAGDTESSRVFNRVVIDKITWRGKFVSGFPGTVSGDYPWPSFTVRMCFILDRQCNGSAPTGAEMFASSSVEYPFRHSNQDNAYRFVWLYDKTFTVRPTRGAVTTEPSANNEYFLEGSLDVQIPIEYSTADQTGGLTGRKSNNIVALWTIDRTSAVALAWASGLGVSPSMQLSTRTLFHDSG